MTHLIPALLSFSLAATALAAGPDWLLDPAPFKAKATQDAKRGEVILDNGLVRRTIRTKNGCATIGLDNLMTGEQVLRSVRPEAQVELDGVKLAVGGLAGQPIHNYLDPQWLETMNAQPGAFEFTGLETGKPQARFPWKKRLEWMPEDKPWPPPGVALTLHFRAPEGMTGDERPRRELLADDFKKLDPAWKPFYSTRHSRTSFINEGKTGEIMALENTAAYVERLLPAGTKAIECKLDAGTDKGATWGIGMVLVYADGGTVKLNLRSGPGHNCFGFNDADTGIKLQDGATYTLRLRLAPGTVTAEASTDGKAWTKIGTAGIAGEPVAVRLGKTDRGGGGSDYSNTLETLGNLERCHVWSFRALGDPEPAKAATEAGVTVDVHYELYDGIPLISKWIVVRNGGKTPVRLNSFIAEILAATEPESKVDGDSAWLNPNLYVETDYAFNNMSAKGANRCAVWGPDPLYATQVHYERQMPCLLECKPPIGPDQILAPGTELESFRVFELLRDSTDRERNSLAQRQMYRTIAPWVTENPVLMHVISSDPKVIRAAIDQCADVGFEMIVLSFGSGFNFESRDKAYQARYKEIADYARSKKIAIGSYSLLASRGAGTGADNTQGVPARFGVMPCLGAKWGQDYLAQLKDFISTAGLGILEHDGSYPGDCCAATTHPGHRGLNDSQWVQWKAITDLYKWCRANGVYLNIPDWYFLSGGTKCGMGYRETNWSLPRAYQEIVERQNIFDGTWEKTPSMGWMFVPLTQYHGGGAAATIEPLKEHLPHYGQRLANLFGSGVQACYRGPRLYDAPETRDLVKRWVDFYKQHRAILNSDFLHLRRADGRDLDYLLHVNPALPEKGLLMVYNPLGQDVKKTLSIPLYYTGIAKVASVSEQDGKAKTFTLDRSYTIELPVTVPAKGTTWFVIKAK
jgi:hypothetical protein